MAEGLSYLSEYQVFQTAKDRCTNPKSQRWHSHGARGIKMVFPSFKEFYDHIGPRPSSEHSLDRIDNDGHYEPGNVRWATRSEQQLNKRKYTVLKRDGKGYYFHKLSGQYMVRVKWFGKCIYVGLFKTEEDAEEAYDSRLRALKEDYGERKAA